MKKVFLWSVLVVFALGLTLTGCDLLTRINTTDNDLEATASGYIHGFVRDQDGAPLNGVTVTYSNPDAGEDDQEATAAQASAVVATESVVTDTSGFFQINELVTGTYRLTFTLDGYTLDTTTVEIFGAGYLFLVDTDLEGSSTVGWKYTDQVLVTLYAKTATATGRIEMEKGSSVIPAASKTVVAMFAGRFFSEVQTDASGVYNFTGLPAGPVAFYARSFYDGALFYPDLLLTYGYDADEDEDIYLATTDLSSRAKSIDPAVWEPSDGITPYVASSNLSYSFAVASNITLTFNKPIASGSFSLVRSGESTVELNFVESWSTDGRTVTLNPVEILLTGTSYSVDYSVTAVDGYSGYSSVPLQFYTEPGIRFISSNVLDLDGTPTQSFSAGGNITLTFSRAIASYNAAEIVLRDTAGETGNTLATTITSSSATVTVNPVRDLASNKEYVVSWTVRSSLDSGTDSDSGSITFKTAKTPLAAPPIIETLALDPSTFEADWDTLVVPFTFDRVSGADGYEVYATDTRNGVEKFLVGTVEDPGPTVYADELSISADLSNSIFDTWAGIGVQPFAHGNAISFTIRALAGDDDETVYGPESATAVTLTDATSPSFVSEGTHTGFPTIIPYVNSSSSTETFTMVFNIDEALHETTQPSGTSSPSWANTTTPPTVSRVTWESQSVTIRVTLLAGSSIAGGDYYNIQFNDTSGNTGVYRYTFVATPQ